VEEASPRRRWFHPLELRQGEAAPFAWAAAYCFCLMASFNVLKPFREALGTATKGIGWLWTGTFIGCVIVLPPFWMLVARLPRQRFIPWVHHFFAVLFAIFFFLLRDEANSPFSFPRTAGVFYASVSVFNLLVLTQMWGFLADVFRREQGNRLFAWVAAGGTAGGVIAAWSSGLIAGWMAEHGWPPADFLWLAIVLLEGATVCALRLSRHAGPAAARPAQPGRTIGDQLHDVFEGVRLFARSPYLRAIAGYMFVSLFTSALLASYQRELLKVGIPDRARQVEYSANLNTITQVIALVGQLLIAAPLLKRAGVAVTLAILHVVGVVVLATFGLSPTLTMVSFAWVAVKGIDYALAKPTRETLFTVVSRAEKYQSKSLIDAGLYRFFDMVDAWIMDGFRYVNASATLVAFVGVPISAAGVWMSRRIAREQAGRLEAGAGATARVQAPEGEAVG